MLGAIQKVLKSLYRVVSSTKMFKMFCNNNLLVIIFYDLKRETIKICSVDAVLLYMHSGNSSCNALLFELSSYNHY